MEWQRTLPSTPTKFFSSSNTMYQSESQASTIKNGFGWPNPYQPPSVRIAFGTQSAPYQLSTFGPQSALYQAPARAAFGKPSLPKPLNTPVASTSFSSIAAAVPWAQLSSRSPVYKPTVVPHGQCEIRLQNLQAQLTVTRKDVEYLRQQNQALQDKIVWLSSTVQSLVDIVIIQSSTAMSGGENSMKVEKNREEDNSILASIPNGHKPSYQQAKAQLAVLSGNKQSQMTRDRSKGSTAVLQALRSRNAKDIQESKAVRTKKHTQLKRRLLSFESN